MQLSVYRKHSLYKYLFIYAIRYEEVMRLKLKVTYTLPYRQGANTQIYLR